MIVLLRIFLLAAIIASVIVGFAYSGLFNVSAMVPHTPVANWFLSTTMYESVQRRADQIDVPDLADVRLRVAGVNDYVAMCANCHGAPGQSPEALALGLNPSPPDLADSARHLSDAEIFWVTKYGIRMTGMPAWGVSHDDDALWPVVAFIRTLPNLDGKSYRDMLTQAQGIGHHANNTHDLQEFDDGAIHNYGATEARARTGNTDSATQSSAFLRHEEADDHTH